jgi:hypothetical protein
MTAKADIRGGCFFVARRVSHAGEIILDLDKGTGAVQSRFSRYSVTIPCEIDLGKK